MGAQDMFFDTPSFKTIINIKKDPNYTEDTSKVIQYADKELVSTIITPFADNENNISFKINKIIPYFLEGGVDIDIICEHRERYLQVDIDGNIHILDKNFNEIKEPITDYLYSQEALISRDKWLAGGGFILLEKGTDFGKGVAFGNEIPLHYTYSENTTKIKVNLYIDRKGEIIVGADIPSHCAYVEHAIPKYKADSFDFSCKSLMIYFFEKYTEKLQPNVLELTPSMRPA